MNAEMFEIELAVISRVMPLSPRVKPSDAAVWVIDAIRQLEYENKLMRQHLYTAQNPESRRLDSWQTAAGIARAQRDQAIQHLTAMLSKTNSFEQAYEAASAGRKFLESLKPQVFDEDEAPHPEKAGIYDNRATMRREAYISNGWTTFLVRSIAANLIGTSPEFGGLKCLEPFGHYPDINPSVKEPK